MLGGYDPPSCPSHGPTCWPTSAGMRPRVAAAITRTAGVRPSPRNWSVLVDIHVVQRLLGHTAIASTVGSTHLAVEDLVPTL